MATVILLRANISSSDMIEFSASILRQMIYEEILVELKTRCNVEVLEAIIAKKDSSLINEIKNEALAFSKMPISRAVMLSDGGNFEAEISVPDDIDIHTRKRALERMLALKDNHILGLFPTNSYEHILGELFKSMQISE